MLKPAAWTFVALALLVGCGESDSASLAQSPEVGTPRECREQVSAALTDSYLRDGGVASITALDKELQVRETCQAVPSDFSVDEAAELARAEIVADLREQLP